MRNLGLCLDALETCASEGRPTRDNHRNGGMHGRGHDLRRINYGNVEDIENENSHDDITWKVKVDVLNFDGTYDPQRFCDWLADIDHLFDWYNMSEARRIRFVKQKLQESAKVYWMSVERRLEREG